jgi:hypothetical protein
MFLILMDPRSFEATELIAVVVVVVETEEEGWPFLEQ